MGGKVLVTNEAQLEAPKSKSTAIIARPAGRAPTDKLRLQVLYRDGFRYVFCGKSPANQIGTVIHIDHVIPFSKGGKTILENLQTLCLECNLGKGNSPDPMSKTLSA